MAELREKLGGDLFSILQENASDLVKPLEWDCESHITRDLAIGVNGTYEAKVNMHGNKVRIQFFPTTGRVETLGYASNEKGLEELRSLVQDHHNSRVLSLLNLGGQGNG